MDRVICQATYAQRKTRANQCATLFGATLEHGDVHHIAEMESTFDERGLTNSPVLQCWNYGCKKAGWVYFVALSLSLNKATHSALLPA